MDGKQCYIIYKPGVAPGIIELDQVDGLDDWSASAGKPPRDQIDHHLNYMTESVERIAPFVRAAYLVPCLSDENGKNWGGGAIYDSKTLVVSYNSSSIRYILDTLYHEIFHAVQQTLTDPEREELYDAVWRRSINYHDDYLNSAAETSARQFASLARFLDDGGSLAAGHDTTTAFMIDVYNGGWARKLKEWQAAAAAAQAKAERRARLLSAARNLVFG